VPIGPCGQTGNGGKAPGGGTRSVASASVNPSPRRARRGVAATKGTKTNLAALRKMTNPEKRCVLPSLPGQANRGRNDSVDSVDPVKKTRK